VDARRDDALAAWCGGRAAAGLVVDGLAVRAGDALRLP
jgi:hypothetical protein